MTPSFKDLRILGRDYGSRFGRLHDQKPVEDLAPFPYREIIMEQTREGATNAERLAAIIEQERREGV